jgi:hypothetical protein
MILYSSQPKLDLLDEEKNGKPLYVLTETFTYYWEKDGKKYRIRIPKGFRTDIASTPQIVWSLGFLPDGKHRIAALLHDWIFLWHRKDLGHSVLPDGSFQVEKGGVWQNASKLWSFTEGNKLFARVMREKKTGKLKRRLMFLAVQLFGRGPWNGIDTEDQKEYEALCRDVL